jgi:drug/metabolite transporter (DMT)-like permease
MRIALAFFVMVGCTAVGNVLLKLGAMIPFGERPIFGMVPWQTCAGILAFGVALMIYSILLQWLPLSVLQSFAACQFIAVVFAAAIFLGEPVSAGRWFGITLIALGIIAVGLSGTVSE